MSDLSKHDPAEVGEQATNPRIRVVEGDSITGADGKLVFDLYELLVEGWSSDVIIATPNIPLAKLASLKEELRHHANADSLDLDAIIYTSLADGEAVNTDRWKMGWDDGAQIFVRIYPKEFFGSASDAKDVFEQKIVPSILSE